MLAKKLRTKVICCTFKVSLMKILNVMHLNFVHFSNRNTVYTQENTQLNLWLDRKILFLLSWDRTTNFSWSNQTPFLTDLHEFHNNPPYLLSWSRITKHQLGIENSPTDSFSPIQIKGREKAFPDICNVWQFLLTRSTLKVWPGVIFYIMHSVRTSRLNNWPCVMSFICMEL